MQKLKVDGMTCGHCEAAVRRALAAVPGVVEVLEVDREQGIAVVNGDADPAALVAAVVAEGYQAAVD